MEVLLGLPPMNNNDGQATVMVPLFRGSGNQPPFTADRANLRNVLIYQANSRHAPGAQGNRHVWISRTPTQPTQRRTQCYPVARKPRGTCPCLRRGIRSFQQESSWPSKVLQIGEKQHGRVGVNCVVSSNSRSRSLRIAFDTRLACIFSRLGAAQGCLRRCERRPWGPLKDEWQRDSKWIRHHPGKARSYYDWPGERL